MDAVESLLGLITHFEDVTFCRFTYIYIYIYILRKQTSRANPYICDIKEKEIMAIEKSCEEAESSNGQLVDKKNYKEG